MDIVTRLRQELRTALTARDTVAVSALRTALGAIANAEAIDPGSGTGSRSTSQHVAGTVPGLGAAEARRRELTEADLERIVRSEIAERQDAARQYWRGGRLDQSERLAREAAVLQAVLDGPPR